MEDQCSWGYYFQDEGLEELKHSLLYTALELQTTILSAQDELARKEDEIFLFKNLLSKITRERDEEQEKCQTLMLEKLMLHQQLQQVIQQQPNMIDAAISSGTTSTEDEQRKMDNSNIFQYSSSDCDESFINISSPGRDEENDRISLKKPLPEKGNFLKAVMEAGPLLQTLLLAGPLPQWQHPPPQLNTLDIPPVTINSSSPTLTPRILHQDSSFSATNYGNCCFSKKRVIEIESNNTTINVDQGCDSSPISNPNKYQKLLHQSSTNNF